MEHTFEEEDYQFSEPVFIPNPEGSAEDDGVVVVSTFNMKDKYEAGLAILDARNLKCIARAKVRANGSVTHCFHGQFAQDIDQVHLY